MANASAWWCRGGIGGLKFQFPDRGKDVSRWAAGRSAAQHASRFPRKLKVCFPTATKKIITGAGSAQAG